MCVWKLISHGKEKNRVTNPYLHVDDEKSCLLHRRAHPPLRAAQEKRKRKRKRQKLVAETEA